ncbi:Helix-turn-helix domain-containing protein [Streptoalloteichus tenebrarius]|uniref:Helix-turn-helix domain-containing protein n=1 Tax=Streptoalloteichus tenebrarius (strain ATCC 17920 / DSM 40477 / JCM 4838 / CBS 697.72 / NBRC 16177 / NCIMB 11028 / NRRL B-12390 / A12253. 1 / ISP 5477) TaxID=1933 RepID=A0ABT1HLN4_STRSD|nr:helix-turn-helix transcriptional regulator [Streptoalloteichus tenebrarius]MCP2256424.1 Helix-turn-helix domain-containing protein [Streptoalloteichus tenebrarius]BFF04775.1 hypothetical protein GCM10020241_64500 [Streptoalloteichus tenebrarius]
MGRPERVIDPTRGPVQRFALELRQLRESAGRPSYRELARRSHYSVTVLSEAAGGTSFPTLAVAMAYAEACGADPAVWQALWEQAAAELASQRNGAAPPLPDKPPYLGRAAFQTADAHRFHGRDAAVAEVRSRVLESDLVALFGDSGIGMSSFLRAGLAPALTEFHTVFVTPSDVVGDNDSGKRSPREFFATVPGTEGLPDGDGKPTGTLLVVDQFEELFATNRKDEEREEFVRGLLDLRSRPGNRVLLAARADTAARCAAEPLLGPALCGNTMMLGPMGRDDLCDAIIRPAANVGLRVDPALVEAVVADAVGQPGSVALVSHAMREVWQRHRGRSLTVAVYHELGGIPGMVARLAEEVFTALRPAEQMVAKELLLRLTGFPSESDHAPRRTSHDELLGDRLDSWVTPVLEKLARNRLVCVKRDGVILAHDALLREWPRMREWLREDRDLLRWHRQLAEAATEWERSGQDAGFLYRGARLAAYGDFPLSRLNDREWAFLTASRRAENGERLARRVRTIVLGAVLSLLAILKVAYRNERRTRRALTGTPAHQCTRRTSWLRPRRANRTSVT